MTLWSAEDTLDGQHQRLDILVNARTVHNGLLQKKKKTWKRISAESDPFMYPTNDPIGQGTELNLNC